MATTAVIIVTTMWLWASTCTPASTELQDFEHHGQRLPPRTLFLSTPTCSFTVFGISSATRAGGGANHVPSHDQDYDLQFLNSFYMLHWNRGRACSKAWPAGFQWKLRHQVAAACLRAADRLDRSGSGSRVVFKFRVSTHVTVMKFSVFDQEHVNLDYMHALRAACAR